MVRFVVSLFDLSETSSSWVAYSLPGLPVLKQLMQIVTMVPGQGGQLVSVLPLTIIAPI